MTQIKTKIPAELEPAAVGGMVTDSKYIIDREQNKTQTQINTETSERVNALEESVGTGGSIDERIAVEKNRAEQAEGVLDGKVATEKQRAEGVEGGLNTRLQTVEQLASISVGGGDIGIGTAADFESDDPSDLAKVPTVGAILDGADEEATLNSKKLIKSGAVFPIKEKTDLIKALSTCFGITDLSGNACLYIKDGILYIYGLQIGVDLIKKGVKGLSITDKNGNATFILKDGVLTIPELQVGNTDTPINADISKFLHPYNCDGGLFQNILCIGDSLTEGDYGSYPAGTINLHKENYPFYLSKKTGAEVDNKGKSGATTMSYWTDELSKIDTTKDYDAIYLFLGTNNYLFSDGLAQDLSVVAPGSDWRNYDTTTGAGAYCAIISWCIENFPSAKLFVINLPYNNIQPTTTQSANYAIQLIANKFNIPVIDIMNNSPFRTDNGKIYRPVGYDEEVAAQGYSNGNLHFGKLGYYTLANCINYLTAKTINNNQDNYSL